MDIKWDANKSYSRLQWLEGIETLACAGGAGIGAGVTAILGKGLATCATVAGASYAGTHLVFKGMRLGFLNKKAFVPINGK